jgi:hypothetical protein
MNKNKSNNKKNQQVIIEGKLEKQRGKIIFPNQLKKANKILDRVGLPKA